MSKSSPADYDTVAANNTDIGGININEGCPAAGINNAIRELMAQIKTAFATVANLLAATSSYLFVSPKTLFDACAWVTLTDAATITPNQNDGINFTVTLGGNRALANMTNLKVGSSGLIEVVQDAAGGRTLTPGSYYKLPNVYAGTLTLSSTANAIDMFSYVVRSSTIIRIVPLRDWAA